MQHILLNIMTRVNAYWPKAFKRIIILVVSVLLTISCKPDAVLTSGEKAAQDIQNTVGSYSQIEVRAQSTGNSDTDTALRISGQFIQVGRTNYNLNQLLWYSYYKPNSTLTLRFP